MRLCELQRGAVNVVVQPGHWRLPRIDHLGIALDEDDFQDVLTRATEWNLPVQERGSRRTFIATNAGYRLEVHPPREWIDDLLDDHDEFHLAELQLRADKPEHKAGVLAKHGVECLLVEKRREIFVYPKARNLTFRSLEIYCAA